MEKILIGGAGGAPSEGVIRSLLQSEKKEEIIGMGSIPSDLAMSAAKRRYVVPYANTPEYKDELMKVLAAERPGLIHFQNDLEVYHASLIRDDIMEMIPVSANGNHGMHSRRLALPCRKISLSMMRVT